jgi:hypothetical protein
LQTDWLLLEVGLTIKYNWSGDLVQPEFYRGEITAVNAETMEHTVLFFFDNEEVTMRLDPCLVAEVCTGCSKCRYEGCAACAI